MSERKNPADSIIATKSYSFALYVISFFKILFQDKKEFV